MAVSMLMGQHIGDPAACGFVKLGWAHRALSRSSGRPGAVLHANVRRYTPVCTHAHDSSPGASHITAFQWGRLARSMQGQ